MLENKTQRYAVLGGILLVLLLVQGIMAKKVWFGDKAKPARTSDGLTAYEVARKAWDLTRDKNYDEAIKELKKGTNLDSDSRGRGNIYYALAVNYNAKGEKEKAIENFGESIKINPKFAGGYMSRAQLYTEKGEYSKAVEDYTEALARNPRNPRASNTLAWMLATCPEDSVRDGSRAVEYAKAACEQTQWKVAPFIDTLAAASAEMSDFEAAVKYQQQAIDLGDTNGKARLELYKAQKPYHEEKKP